MNTLKILALGFLSVIMTGCMQMTMQQQIAPDGLSTISIEYDMSGIIEMAQSQGEDMDIAELDNFCADFENGFEEGFNDMVPMGAEVEVTPDQFECQQSGPGKFALIIKDIPAPAGSFRHEDGKYYYKVTGSSQDTKALFDKSLGSNEGFSMEGMDMEGAGDMDPAMMAMFGVKLEMKIVMPGPVLSSDVGTVSGNTVTINLLTDNLEEGAEYWVVAESGMTAPSPVEMVETAPEFPTETTVETEQPEATVTEMEEEAPVETTYEDEDNLEDLFSDEDFDDLFEDEDFLSELFGDDAGFWEDEFMTDGMGDTSSQESLPEVEVSTELAPVTAPEVVAPEQVAAPVAETPLDDLSDDELFEQLFGDDEFSEDLFNELLGEEDNWEDELFEDFAQEPADNYDDWTSYEDLDEFFEPEPMDPFEEIKAQKHAMTKDQVQSALVRNIFVDTETKPEVKKTANKRNKEKAAPAKRTYSVNRMVNRVKQMNEISNSKNKSIFDARSFFYSAAQDKK